MSVRITADSTCDLSAELLERYSVSIYPLSVSLGDRTGKDGVNMTPEDIYAYVEKTGDLPKSSAVNVGEYADFFSAFVQNGDSLVHFSLGSGFSSTHQNACLAAEDFENVYVVDSANLSTGQGLVVIKAAEMAAAGKSAKEIYDACCLLTKNVEASFVLDNLSYLKKGGRCSSLAALGANLLKLKPCIEVKDGSMGVGKKYRGNIGNVMLDYVKDRLSDREDIDTSRIFITHTKCDPADVEAVKNAVKEIRPDFEEVLETTAGCTITTHCGPGTLGILFIRK